MQFNIKMMIWCSLLLFSVQFCFSMEKPQQGSESIDSFVQLLPMDLHGEIIDYLVQDPNGLKLVKIYLTEAKALESPSLIKKAYLSLSKNDNSKKLITALQLSPLWAFHLLKNEIKSYQDAYQIFHLSPAYCGIAALSLMYVSKQVMPTLSEFKSVFESIKEIKPVIIDCKSENNLKEKENEKLLFFRLSEFKTIAIYGSISLEIVKDINMPEDSFILYKGNPKDISVKMQSNCLIIKTKHIEPKKLKLYTSKSNFDALEVEPSGDFNLTSNSPITVNVITLENFPGPREYAIMLNNPNIKINTIYFNNREIINSFCSKADMTIITNFGIIKSLLINGNTRIVNKGIISQLSNMGNKIDIINRGLINVCNVSLDANILNPGVINILISNEHTKIDIVGRQPIQRNTQDPKAKL